MSTAKLIVGYTCRMLPDEMYQELLPVFEPNGTLKKPENCKTEAERAEAEQKIAASIADKRAKFLADAKYVPYIGTFQRVVIHDLKNKRTGRWSCEGAKPFGEKDPISERIVAWLLKGHPNAWGGIDAVTKEPATRFLGFGMRGFLKMLGVEATLPNSENVPPPKLWYSNSDHREIADAVAPDEAGKLDLKKLIARRAPTDKAALKTWHENFDKWEAPHVSADLDAWLCTELASQLGFLTE